MRNAETARLGRRIFSTTAEHALRAVLHLASRPTPGRVAAAEVARALGTPPNYTGKTLRLLARKGLLRSVRGPAGGFELRREAGRITLADLVGAVDEQPRATSVCLLGDRRCDEAQPCHAHERWSALLDEVGALMEKMTIADLLGESAQPAAPNAGGRPAQQVIGI